jgi:hypothetical protein
MLLPKSILPVIIQVVTGKIAATSSSLIIYVEKLVNDMQYSIPSFETGRIDKQYKTEVVQSN